MGPVHLSRSTLARPLGGSPQKWLPDRTDTDDTRNKRARIRRIPAGTTRASHELRRAAGPRPADNSLHPNCDPITWPSRASGGTTLANPGSRPPIVNGLTASRPPNLNRCNGLRSLPLLPPFETTGSSRLGSVAGQKRQMAGHSHCPGLSVEHRTQTYRSDGRKGGGESVLTRIEIVLPWSGRLPAAAIEATGRNDCQKYSNR